MKKCPFCKAEIEDHARFCLYCMKTLEEKQVITPPKSKRKHWLPLLLGAAVVILLLCLAVMIWIGAEDPEPATESHATASTEFTSGTPSSPPEDSESNASEEDSDSFPTIPDTETTDATAPGEEISAPTDAPSPTDTAAPETQEPSRDTEPVTTPKPEQPPTTGATEPVTSTKLQQSTTTGVTEPVTSTKPQQSPTTEATEPVMSTKPQQSPTTEATEQPPATETTVAQKPEPTLCEHHYILSDLQEASCTDDGFKTYTCEKCGDCYQQIITAAGHRYTPANCRTPKVCTQCNKTDGNPLGHSYSGGYCLRCNAPDYTDPKVVFSYREVGPSDYFSPDSYIPGSDIVITGIKEVSPDGIYEVPDYIGGKRVVGILSLAFSSANARKITLGKNIIRVNQNAFSGCFDLEALYIRSDKLFLSRSAFVTAPQRNCKLTIYCSANCVVDDDLYGDCHLKEIVRVYGAEYQEL